MCINFVISNSNRTEWNWRVVNADGKTIANSKQTFETRYECIADAESFQRSLEEARFYDFAGIPIDQMHLANGSLHAGTKPIKILTN